jgi:hypothetical protein
MANSDSTYIARNAAPLVNPTSATIFSGTISPIATVASTQVVKSAFVRYAGYLQGGAGTSNNINLVRISVRAAGRIVFGAAGSFTPSIAIGTAGTTVAPLPTSSAINILGSLTPLAASGAGVGMFDITINLDWDPNSGLIAPTVTGTESTLVAGTGAMSLTANAAGNVQTGYVGVAPLTTLPTTAAAAAAQVNNGGEVSLFFLCTGLFSATNANNLAYLDAMAVEVL